MKWIGTGSVEKGTQSVDRRPFINNTTTADATSEIAFARKLRKLEEVAKRNFIKRSYTTSKNKLIPTSSRPTRSSVTHSQPAQDHNEKHSSNTKLPHTLLLDADGYYGGMTSRNILFEQVLTLKKGDVVLLLVPWKMPSTGVSNKRILGGRLKPTCPPIFSLCENEGRTSIFQKWQRFVDSNSILHGYTFTSSGETSSSENNGKVLQIPACVYTDNDGQKLLVQSAGELSANDGIAFTFYSENDCSISKVVQGIRFNDILKCKVYLRDNNSKHEQLIDFSPQLKKKDTLVEFIATNQRIIHKLAEEMHGDSTQMFYFISKVRTMMQNIQTREMSKSTKDLQNQVQLLKIKVESTKDLSCFDSQMDFELGTNGGALVEIEKMDQVAKNFIENFYKGWVSFARVKMGEFNFSEHFKRIKENAPHVWAATGIVNAPRSKGRRENKRNVLSFMSLARSRNQSLFPNLSKLLTFDSIASGASSSTKTAANLKVQQDVSYVYKYSRENIVPMAERNQLECLKKEGLKIVVYDNFQNNRKKKFQSNMSSSRFHAGTQSVVIRVRRQELPKNTILKHQNLNQLVRVESSLLQDDDEYMIKYTACEVSCIEDNEGEMMYTDVPDSRMFEFTSDDVTNIWNVVCCKGLSEQPKELTYFPKQEIPAPIGMPISTTDYNMKLKVSRFITILLRYSTNSNIGSHSTFYKKLHTKSESNSDLIKELRLVCEGNHNIGRKYKGKAATGTCQLHVLKFLNYDETRHDGTSAVVQKELQMIGHTEYDQKTKKHKLLRNDMIFWYGDELSMRHLRTLIEKLKKLSVELDDPSKICILLKALEKSVLICGDFHGSMHILVAIFVFAYGGFLQPIQAALGWKRISIDVPKAYQNDKRLMLMVLEQMLRELVKKWVKEVVENEMFEIKEGNDTANVDFETLWKYMPTQVAECLQQSWSRYLERQTSDKALSFALQFVDMGLLFVEHEDAISRGDPIALELLCSKMLILFGAMGKSNYVKLQSNLMETLYLKLSPLERDEQRKNRFVKLDNLSTFLSIDHLIELVNNWHSFMSSGSMDLKILQSVILPLCRVIKRVVAPTLRGESLNPPRETMKVLEELNRRIISAMIESSKILEDLGRKDLNDNLLWEHVDDVREKFKQKAKDIEAEIQSKGGKEKLALCDEDIIEVFNQVKDNETSSLPDGEEETESDDDTEGQEEENEEGSGGMELVETAKDKAKRLLNMKKYEFHKIAHDNYMKVGQENLKDLKADRLRKRKKIERQEELTRKVGKYQERVAAESRRFKERLQKWKSGGEDTEVVDSFRQKWIDRINSSNS